MNRLFLRAIGFVACLGLIIILPRIVPAVQMNILIEMTYFALFAVTFNMLLGYGGLLSFGHSAYFGLGGYTLALLFKHVAGFPLLLTILMGGVAGGLGGIIIGSLCVRMKGAYFALLTLAFNQFLYAVALKWRAVTGGDDGLAVVRPNLYLPGLGTVNMYKTANVFYLVVTIVLISLFCLWYLTKTPFGNTIRSIKENEQRANFIGHNVFVSKLFLYTLSAFFAGIAGSLYGFFLEFVSTGSIGLHLATEVIFMAIIGGTRSFFGPILGAGVYVYFTDWVSRITERWEFALGVVFILLVMYVPRGLIGLVAPERIKGLLGKRKAEGSI
jgi:branched-chain amino acid transport system permease protein